MTSYIAAIKIDVLIQALTAIAGAVIAGGFFYLGPQRKLMTRDAAEKGVDALSKVQDALEKRIKALEDELSNARTSLETAEKRIKDLETGHELTMAKSEAASAEIKLQLERALRERDQEKARVVSLEKQINDIYARAPHIADRRSKDRGSTPPEEDKRE